MADIGLYGLAVMGQNFALNMASKGFTVSVCNRSHDKVRRTPRLSTRLPVLTPWKYESASAFLGTYAHGGFPLTQVDTTVARAQAEGNLPLHGYKDVSGT